MRSSLLTLAAVFAVLFLGVTLWRGARNDEAPMATDDDAADRIRRFWRAYEDATRARTGRDFSTAVELYRLALELDPRHEDTSFYLAVSLVETGAYREAATVLRKLTHDNPSSARGWSQLGAVLASRAPGADFDAEGASEAFSRSEALNPEHSGPFLSRGKLALELGNDDEALRLFRTAADMGSPEGAFEAGLVAYRARAWDEAASMFRRVLDTSDRERRIAGRGATSEGDVETAPDAAEPEPDTELTALESARIRALCFLYWTTRKTGGYRDEIPARDRITFETAAPSSRGIPRTRLVSPDASKDSRETPPLEWVEAGGGTVADVAVADFDGDGRDDVFVLGWKTPARLFRNQGSRFEDVTESSGLNEVGGDGLSALFFDLEGDSDPDLLVTAHAPLALSLRRLLEPERRVRKLTPRLFRNDGAAGFVEVTSEAGLDRNYGVVEARTHDVDGDGLPDLLFAMGALEADHLEPSLVLRNREGKRFEEWAYLPSIDEPHRSLGVRVASDGAIELLVAESSP